MADYPVDLLFIGWLWCLVGCRTGIAFGHFTLPRLALCAVLWPFVLWLALCDSIAMDPEERP